MIFDKWVKGSFSITGTDGEDREFALKRHKVFEDMRNFRQLGLGFGHVFRVPQYPLAFAVVTHTGSFENRGKAELLNGRLQVAWLRHSQKIRGVDAQISEERFFGETILRGTPPTNKKMFVEGVTVSRHANGRLQESRVSWDALGM